MRVRYNLVRKKFGRLLVTSFHHKDEKYRSNFWNCQCECGNILVLSASTLQRKKRPTISCGCYRYDRVSGQPAPNRLLKGRANFNSLFQSYIKAAKQREIIFLLTQEEFRQLTSQNCHYCNSEPLQNHSKRETYGSYLYNGIDRLDSDKSYILDNCVSCCKVCNYAKRIMTVEEFKFWITRVYNNFVNRRLEDHPLSSAPISYEQ
jgi:hypothetical protein